jgi:hypothetical protein
MFRPVTAPSRATKVIRTATRVPGATHCQFSISHRSPTHRRRISGAVRRITLRITWSPRPASQPSCRVGLAPIPFPTANYSNLLINQPGAEKWRADNSKESRELVGEGREQHRVARRAPKSALRFWTNSLTKLASHRGCGRPRDDRDQSALTLAIAGRVTIRPTRLGARYWVRCG